MPKGVEHVDCLLTQASPRDTFRNMRDELARKMTDTQVGEAQKLAREWKPKLER